MFELYKLVKSCESCQAFPTSQVPCLSPFPCYPLTFLQYPTNVLHYMKVMKKISKIYKTQTYKKLQLSYLHTYIFIDRAFDLIIFQAQSLKTSSHSKQGAYLL